MPLFGTPVGLIAKLFDKDPSQFVRATVKKADGTPIVGSPFTLPHRGLGEYGLNTVLMQNTPFMSAALEVFKDAGFTIPNRKYGDGSLTFELVPPTANTIIFTGDEFLTGTVSSETLAGLLEETEELLFGTILDFEILAGSITEEVLSGSVIEESSISGGISEETIDGTLEGC